MAKRGFALMSEGEKFRIASLGGVAAHKSGNAHEWTPDEARAAGRKGGLRSHGGRGSLTSAGSAPGAGRIGGRSGDPDEPT